MSRAWVALAAALLSAPVFAGPNVGVSISIGPPAWYGHGGHGHVAMGPVVVYPQPIYAPAPVIVHRPFHGVGPMHHGYYGHGHQAQGHRHWRHHHHHGGFGHGRGDDGYGRGHGRWQGGYGR